MGKGKQQGSFKKKKKKEKQRKTNKERAGATNPTENEGACSLYRRYKDATQRVKKILQTLTPSKFRQDRVHNLLEATDWIAKEGKPLTHKRQLLSDLRVAIGYRKKYSKQFDEGGDHGHSYFVTVLNYCYQELRKCPCDPEELSATQSKKEETQDNAPGPGLFTNAFAALSVDDYEDDKENASDWIEPEDVPRPKRPEKPYSLNEYLESVPQSVHALRFFELLNEHMLIVHHCFERLKAEMKSLRDGELAEPDMCRLLRSIAIAMNQCLEHVQQMEGTIALECPTLNSPYRILACAFHTQVIRNISDVVQKESPIGTRFLDDTTVGLVSDLIESVFRGHPGEHGKAIVKVFCKRWRLPPATFVMIENYAMGLWVSILRDTATLMETNVYGKIEFELFPEREWLQDYFFLSGERSFLNTLKMMDLVSSWIERKPHVFNASYNTDNLPPVWHETENPATKICGDMDMTVAQPIFMFLEAMWRSPSVDFEKELLPLVYLFRQLLQKEGKKMTCSHAFAVHMIAVSIFELQGDGDVALVAEIAQKYVVRHIDQLLRLVDDDKTRDKEEYKYQISMLKTLLNIDNQTGNRLGPFSAEVNARCERVAIWSPACSAMILQYVMLGSSFAVGSAYLDTFTEVRVVLHLFNALKQRGLVNEDLPIISTLDLYLESCTAIWNRWGKPEQGKFIYRYFLCLGCGHKLCIDYQERGKAACGGAERRAGCSGKTSWKHRWDQSRADLCINMGEVSKAYSKIFLHEHDGSGADNEIDTRKIYLTGTTPLEIQEVYGRICECLQATDEEDDLLQLNFFVVGALLKQFMEELVPSSERAPPAGSNETGETDYIGDALMYLHQYLGMLDYLDDHPYFTELSQKFETFFRNVDPRWVKMDL